MRISPIELSDIAKLAPFQPLGWDDIPRDFQAFIDKPYYDQVKGEVGGVIVAIGAVIYHKDTAWLAKIIVHPDHRNKGYGKAITQGLIDRIRRSRYRTIYLDATDMGHPVYKALGFVDEVSYQHFSRPDGWSQAEGEVRSRLSTGTDRSGLLALDQAVYSEDRLPLLADHLLSARVVEAGGCIVAAYFPTVMQGPIIATDVQYAIPLIRERLGAFDKAQLPMTNTPGIRVLKGLGCEETRISRRMFLGERRDWRPDLLFNRTSGQLG
jgi:GNAT superfamily N-acetyltransferase